MTAADRAYWKAAFESAFHISDKARLVEAEAVLEVMAELSEAKTRRDDAERAWAEAINRARDAEDEVRRLEKELDEEAE